MSSSRTPTKSGGSKKDESKNSQTPTSQSGTPPVGSPQRRNVAGSQIASPTTRSGAASAASPSANRQKINSADKQSTASPVPIKSATSRTEVAENTQFLPPGIHSLFISSTTQQALQLCVDEDITQENNTKMIEKEVLLNDIQTNAQGSNFYEFQQQIQNYPENEIAIIYDYDYFYSQNFLICFDVKLKKFMENPPVTLPLQENDEVEQYVPPVPKQWISLGSEIEIDEERLVLNRPLKRLKIKVPTRPAATSAVTPAERFKDVDPDIDRKKNIISIDSYEDKQFELKKLELDLGIQAAPEFRENSSQTIWRYPKNQWTQYEARTFTEEEKSKSMADPELINAVINSQDLFKEALQQNVIHDPFYLDWNELGGDLDGLGGPGDSHLKEYQSFSSIKQSRDKIVTCVQWHPTLRGIIAVSLAAGQGFDERTDELSKITTSPSLILIWSFVDPIQPKLYLEAPEDIQCFQFCPTDPHVIAGGCVNGQVVMWDIKEYEERIKNPRGDHRDKDLFIPGFEDESFFQTPHIRYCAVSNIEHGHAEPITDLQWIPDHFQITAQGLPTENLAANCSQIMTCAFDTQVLLWETRPPRGGVKPLSKKEREILNPMGVPLTFKHLDLIWKPLLRIQLQSPEAGMVDFAPRKFSIRETQGDRESLNKEEKEIFEKKKDTTSGGQFVNPVDDPNRTISQAKAKVLQNIDTFFYIGTEDGQLVYQDWMPQKEQDSTKLITPKAAWSANVVDGPVVALKRSPFFKDVLIIAGGWMFQIWREKIHSGSLLHMAPLKEKITDVEWSPTRPGVFFIAKQNGSVDIWDIVDRTHGPSISQSISSSAVTYLNIKNISSKQQLLAAGDSSGTLHILEVPWALKQPVNQELQVVTNYLDRETERRAFVKHRWNLREEEKREKDRLASLKVGIAPSHIPTQEEIDIRLKGEYNDFLQFEFSILREMGLRDENEAPVIVPAAT